MTKIEENQMVESVKSYAREVRRSEKMMKSQNYRDAAAYMDLANIARQDVERWSALLAVRAAADRSA